MRPARLALFVIAVVVCAQPAFAERGITPTTDTTTVVTHRTASA